MIHLYQKKGLLQKIVSGGANAFPYQPEFACNAIMRSPMDNYDMILAAEEQFAREVILGVIVVRPLTVWHYLIPGMFIIDFLRRGSAIRQYTRHFMFPRKLALDAALAIAQRQDKTSVDSQVATDISKWLNTLNLSSRALLQAHRKLIDVLTDHYLKLIHSMEDNYDMLLADAYQNRSNFITFVRQITAAENEVDQLVMQYFSGNEKVREKMQAEQQQIAKRRNKILDDVF